MEAKVIAVASDILGCSVDASSSLADVSSLKILQIIMALDEEGISVPLEKIAKVKSISDILAFAEEE